MSMGEPAVKRMVLPSRPKGLPTLVPSSERLEIRIEEFVHHELGEPARVLRVEDGYSTSLGRDQVRVRVSYAPIHPGDLLGIMGSPAFGTPPTIASRGRVPGFEGAGVVSEIGAKVDPALGLKQGLRVAFFPASGAWSDEAVAPASSVVPLPDSIPGRSRRANAD
jgi:NADPH2:quinone reductase